ncbi:nucleolar GTP-binding protein 1-domain-containing protein [Ganoderma leucocontextum]|nr:nucleolar GTP-binding protein 1-domain-containing protein [Ganoderma leucocontextum]
MCAILQHIKLRPVKGWVLEDYDCGFKDYFITMRGELAALVEPAKSASPPSPAFKTSLSPHSSLKAHRFCNMQSDSAPSRHLIDHVAKDYVWLLKFGDSLYRCKQLKRAALSRMAMIMRRQNEVLEFLEEVRKHISRLPAIDPTAPTLLICGYPNPYAFTTKSLFVGHLDYHYMRWQVIDTPGILDHPLEEMNNIEMQSITVLAHLKACVLYFMDLSEQCGYSVEAQCQLFNAIKPLFANKPTVIVLNKADVSRLDDLAPERHTAVEEIINGDGRKCRAPAHLRDMVPSSLKGLPEHLTPVNNATFDPPPPSNLNPDPNPPFMPPAPPPGHPSTSIDDPPDESGANPHNAYPPHAMDLPPLAPHT